MSVIHHLKNKNNLTKREQAVANYVIKYPQEVILFTVTTLAENTATSLATVLRLIKKLGYKTFGEFKLALTIDNVEEQTKQTIQPMQDSIIDEIINSINHTKNKLDLNAIKKAATLITQARRVIIYGYGVSYSVAYFLYFKLLKIGINTTIINNTYESIAITTSVSKGDLAVLISGSGSSTDILDMAKLFKVKNHPVIALSNMANSPLVQFCTHLLVAGIPDDQLHSGAAYSRIPLIIIVEYLIKELTANTFYSTNLKLSNVELSKKEF